MRTTYTFNEASRVWKKAQELWDTYTRFYSECQRSNEVVFDVLAEDEDRSFKPEATIEINTAIGILENTKIYDLKKMVDTMLGWFNPEEMGAAYYELKDLIEAHIAFRAGLRENDLELVEEYVFQINELLEFNDEFDLLLKALVHLRMMALNRPTERVQRLIEAESGLPVHWFRV